MYMYTQTCFLRYIEVSIGVDDWISELKILVVIMILEMHTPKNTNLTKRRRYVALFP